MTVYDLTVSVLKQIALREGKTVDEVQHLLNEQGPIKKIFRTEYRWSFEDLGRLEELKRLYKTDNESEALRMAMRDILDE